MERPKPAPFGTGFACDRGLRGLWRQFAEDLVRAGRSRLPEADDDEGAITVDLRERDRLVGAAMVGIEPRLRDLAERRVTAL